MEKIAAGEAKNSFGKMLDTVQKHPVIIEKKGRAVAVVMSIEEYEKLEKLENEFWLDKASKAEKRGFIGERKSAKLLKELLNVQD